MAIRVMGFTAAYPLGGLLQGWLADRWGPAVVVTAAGSLLVAIGVALAVRSEWLTPLDDPPEAYAA
jgi:MFS family permease